MKSVKVTDMSPELLDGSSTECVTCSNHHTETIVKQPKADLQTQIEKKKEEKKAAFNDLFSPILHNSAFSQMAGWKTLIFFSINICVRQISMKFWTFLLTRDVFSSCRVRATKESSSESSRRIEPQTLEFRASMLYHWGTETLRWARPSLRFSVKRVLKTARVNSVESVMHVNGIRTMVNFSLGNKLDKDVFFVSSGAWEVEIPLRKRKTY